MIITPRKSHRTQGRLECTRNRKTLTETSIDDLREARYMSLSCPPASPKAKALVEDIIDITTKSDTELALDILSQQFSSKTGIRPKLRVK